MPVTEPPTSQFAAKERTSFGRPDVRLLRRKCACGGTAGSSGECEECGKNSDVEILQRKANQPAAFKDQRFGAPPIVHEVLRSPGEPLDAGTRAFMEPRFGHDFSEVRIHADEKGAQSAHAVNAHAYTVGNDIIFGAGAYEPTSQTGKSLLAHELAHVVQQEGSHLASEASRLEIGDRDDVAEAQATKAEALVSASPTYYEDHKPSATPLQPIEPRLQRKAVCSELPPPKIPPQCQDPSKRRCMDGPQDDMTTYVQDPETGLYETCTYQSYVCECYDKDPNQQKGPPFRGGGFNPFNWPYYIGIGSDPEIVGGYKGWSLKSDDD
jgi:hypothetical protein